MSPKGSGTYRGACDVRPHPSGIECSTEVQHRNGDGVSERQISYSDSPKIQGIKQGFNGRDFGSRGYCDTTIGLDDERIRAYVRGQEHQDKQEELGVTNTP